MKINIVRRFIQILILILFILGNLKILNILEGNLSSSILFGGLGLSDPYAVLQIYLATFSVSATAISGALLVLFFYSIIASRAFCSWVCPVNLITDFAYFFRKKFNYAKDTRVIRLPKNFRYYFLGLSLILSFVLSTPAFEQISFVGVIQRGIIFGNVMAIGVAFFIFAFDAFILERGICSNICPLGAFYSLAGKFAFVRVEHTVENCTRCMDCKKVCPEKQVLNIVGKKNAFIKSECISCGRCIDICKHDALNFSIRHNKEN
ncbi:menaquinol dehydrogenase NapGH, membrane component NapH [Campylobacter blaseri]|uniref:Quinol dehydrogenase ferredoxin subunit NapH n=1 Tax=Campylobacter blaseri TaxID=2042961 RepID=A0A2P8R0P2_9BACT|nr:quinol dehydrogenase ferredoxin subunit NapH [Campylobacter blaseri]PSM52064.1 quinol dehydrogenase ferredoxin subunit NapH [Campylobacter blaseri]PSM53849.1 quinol dehydrogenase ferredoxin subunit NapH [Campylobacter blaseri]QKF85598.1 menaquinol dehydrogenase NapGH, membrane component NapH [Campylobacter blaseri]